MVMVDAARYSRFRLAKRQHRRSAVCFEYLLRQRLLPPELQQLRFIRSGYCHFIIFEKNYLGNWFSRRRKQLSDPMASSESKPGMKCSVGRRRIRKLTSHLQGSSQCPGLKKLKNKTLVRRHTSAVRNYTREDVVAKRQEGKCWIVISNNVYDITEFLEEHPGGEEIITDIAAGDFEAQQQEFDDAEHSEEAMEDLAEYFKGRLVDSKATDSHSAATEVDKDVVSVESHSDEEEGKETEELEELQLRLIDRIQLSADVWVFRFALPSATNQLGLPVGQHILLSFTLADGHRVSRPYTPVSPLGELGFIDILIKLYPDGKMSNHISSLPIDSPIAMRGPKGKLVYHGHGSFSIKKGGKQHLKKVRRVGMIAGGSGVTPMFQIIQAVAADTSDPLHVTLLLANKTLEDVLLKHLLDCAARRNANISVHYTLDEPPPDWDGLTGFITADMLASTMPAPAEDTMIFLCGPPAMVKKACVPALAALNYPRDHLFKF